MFKQFFKYISQSMARMIGISIYILADTFFISLYAGADAGLMSLGHTYLQIVLIATPVFMSNYTFTAFARNDQAPTTAMIGSIAGRFDYIFMFPLNMGMAGAALATALSTAVTMAIFNGLSQGMQPLVSEKYGRNQMQQVKQLRKWSLIVCLIIEAILLVISFGMTDTLIGIFNSEQNAQLLVIAYTGLRLYFLGFLFAGVNIVMIAYDSAIDHARPAMIGSLMRGLIAIAGCAMILSRLLGINGVWLSFLASEILTFGVMRLYKIQ